MIFGNKYLNLFATHSQLNQSKLVKNPTQSIKISQTPTQSIKMSQTPTDVVHITVFNSGTRGDFIVDKSMIPTWLNDCAIDDFKIMEQFAEKSNVTLEEHRTFVLQQIQEFVHGFVAFDRNGIIANGHVDVPDLSKETSILQFLLTLMSRSYRQPKLSNINMHYLILSI